jgi:hypothetical protein
MKIQPHPAWQELLRAKLQAPMGLLEYSIDPIAQAGVGKVLASASTLRHNESLQTIR